MADSAITAIERHIADKLAELQRVQADLAALQRTLAILKGTAVTGPSATVDHAEGRISSGFSGTRRDEAHVVTSSRPKVPQRGPGYIPLPKVILAVLRNTEHPMTPIEIDRAIRETGRTMHQNSVTGALSKLLADGLVTKTDHRYATIDFEKRPETVEGNVQLDPHRQEESGEAQVMSRVPGGTTNGATSPQEQNASSEIGEAF